MKFDQVLLWVLCAVVLLAAWKMFTEAFDEITWDYDPETGRQRIKAQKNGLLAGAAPLVLEGR
jgi:hypothetical protein